MVGWAATIHSKNNKTTTTATLREGHDSDSNNSNYCTSDNKVGKISKCNNNNNNNDDDNNNKHYNNIYNNNTDKLIAYTNITKSSLASLKHLRPYHQQHDDGYRVADAAAAPLTASAAPASTVPRDEMTYRTRDRRDVGK